MGGQAVVRREVVGEEVIIVEEADDLQISVSSSSRERETASVLA